MAVQGSGHPVSWLSSHSICPDWRLTLFSLLTIEANSRISANKKILLGPTKSIFFFKWTLRDLRCDHLITQRALLDKLWHQCWIWGQQSPPTQSSDGVEMCFLSLIKYSYFTFQIIWYFRVQYMKWKQNSTSPPNTHTQFHVLKLSIIRLVGILLTEFILFSNSPPPPCCCSPLKCDEVKYVNLSHNFLINTISASSITSSLKLWWGESNNTKWQRKEQENY